MTVLSAVQASRYLGVTERTIRNWINRGELSVLSTDPIRLDSGHVDSVLRARQADAVADLVRRRQDPIYLARETRHVLHPRHSGANLPQYRAEDDRRRLSMVSDTARLLFGQAALTAAMLTDDSCRWCKAGEFASVLNTWAPAAYSAGFAALFDQEPCAACGPGLYAPVMEALRSQVHRGRARPSRPSAPPSREQVRLAEQWAAGRAVTAAARPVDNDDGRAMVRARLQDVRARLKAARRRGDTTHALALQRQLQSLTADASTVDGRAAAAGKPGVLKCGHALSVGCGCPRKASR